MKKEPIPLLHSHPFPKRRPPLPESYARIYGEWMAKNRMGLTQTTSLSTKLEQWMHRQVAKDLGGFRPEDAISTLELGAGTGNHLAFDSRSNHYDVIEPMQELYRMAPAGRVRTRYEDIGDIQGKEIYDRVVSIAVLEHLENLPAVLARAKDLLKPGGTFRAGIPSEGGWLWRQAWKNTTSRTFSRLYGLDYERLLAYEHINAAAEIRREMEKVFGPVKASYFGCGYHLSFYQFLEARKPD